MGVKVHTHPPGQRLLIVIAGGINGIHRGVGFKNVHGLKYRPKTGHFKQPETQPETSEMRLT